MHGSPKVIEITVIINNARYYLILKGLCSFVEETAKGLQDLSLFYFLKLCTNYLFEFIVREHGASRPFQIMDISTCPLSYPIKNSSTST